MLHRFFYLLNPFPREDSPHKGAFPLQSLHSSQNSKFTQIPPPMPPIIISFLLFLTAFSLQFAHSSAQIGQMPPSPIDVDIPLRPSGCAQFLECERKLMEMHKNCTERSRKAIGEKCGLREEFEELARMGQRRMAELGECVLGANGTEGAEECWKGAEMGANEGPRGECWLGLGELRKRCHSLQECCISSKKCIQWLAKSESSNALRRQHRLINRKTLQCRSSFPSKVHLAAKKTKIGPAKMAKEGVDLLSARLDYFEQLLRILERRARPKQEPNWMVQLAAHSGRPSQFLADHQPKGIFPASRRIQRERKATAAVQQLIGRRQAQSFALPPGVDLHRMRILAARPKLAKSFGAAEQRRRILTRGMGMEMDAFGRGRKKAFGVRGVEGGKLGVKKELAPFSTTQPPPMPSNPSTPFAPANFSPIRIFPQIWVSTRPPPPFADQTQILPAEMPTTPMWGEEIEKERKMRIGTTKIEIKLGGKGEKRHFGEAKRRRKNGKKGAEKKVEITLKGSRQKMENKRGYRGKLLAAKIHAGMAGKEKMERKEIRRSPQKWRAANYSKPKFGGQLKNGRAELEELRRELVEKLERFAAKNGPKWNQKGGGILALNQTKKDSDRLGLGLDHCRLFSACQSQMRLLQSGPCPSPSAGRLVPGPPRRRFGRCNSRLLPLFEKMDGARAELERKAEKCVEEEMEEGRQKTKAECPRDWPILPAFSPQMDCPERISLLNQHCRKLGKCCASLESCQREIEGTELARQIRREEQKLGRRSAKCQMQAQEMFKRMKEKNGKNIGNGGKGLFELFDKLKMF